MSPVTFSIVKTSGSARRGRLVTPHGVVETPQFMPVGTQATVKGVDVERLSEMGATMVLVNTYHLSLRPTSAHVKARGGIHRFMGWKGPILSDSGGFQVFSLRGLRTLTEAGVEFQSHIDGSKHFLSPERSIASQEELGVDVAMAFDECPAYQSDRVAVSKSLDMTLRWAERSLKARSRSDMALFGITQGGVFRDLRDRSAQGIGALPFDGFAIGGLSVGEPKHEMYDVLSYHVASLPVDKVHYLMGVGTPEDLVTAVSRGVDLFDCVMPTRSGRFGRAFVRGVPPYINIRNAAHAQDDRPIEEGCSCLACRNYSRAYLHHLFRVGEMLGPQLLSIHNLAHYQKLMSDIRVSLEEGTFHSFASSIQEQWKDVSPEPQGKNASEADITDGKLTDSPS